MKLALLIIDMQKGVLRTEESRETVRSAVEYINEVSGYFRQAQLPVIIIQDVEVDEGPGSKGYELIEELVVDEKDLRFTKKHSNGFYQTDLEDKLHELGIEYLIISGFAAEHCVLFTYNGAIERGFGASLLQHGLAGYSKKRIRDTEDLRNVINHDALSFFLKQ